MKKNKLLALIILVAFWGCKDGALNISGEKPLFTLTDSSDTHFFFWNEVHESEQLNALNYGYFYNGGGVGIGDINNDGLPDIYMVGNAFGGRLFLNEGKFKFKQITETSNTHCDGYTNGVSMVDVNGDGYLDIYLSKSMAMVDSDRANMLFINNKDNTFTERAKEFGLADEGFSTHTNFFDYDKDGDLDAYVVNHSIDFRAAYGIITKEQRAKAMANISSEDYKKYVSHLYRNNGNGSFTDLTQQAGLKDIYFGLSATAADINNDGWTDIYGSSDFSEKDHLYLNNKNGTFTDAIDVAMGHISKNSMGSDIADINNDGLLDIMTLDMMAEDNYRNKQLQGNNPYDVFHLAIEYGYHCQVMRNCLQLNNGDGTFSEIGQFAGVSHTDWSWAPLFADYDNDGKKDLFVSNGYPKDITDVDYLNYTSNEIISAAGGKENAKLMDLINAAQSTPIQNYIFKNMGNCQFQQKSKDWGLQEKVISNGAAYADLDLDGDLDLIINNFNTPSFLYRNNTRENNPQNNFISFTFKPEQYNLVQGTKITLLSDSGIQYQELTNYRGFLSTMQQILHFGIGSLKNIQEVQISYPNGTIEKINAPTINKIFTLDIKNGVLGSFENKEAQEANFVEVPNAFSPSYNHTESPFIDFKDEPLLEQMYSNRGPFLSVGDVNGDALDDLYIGSSAGFESNLYIQQNSGQFLAKTNPVFEQDKMFEDGQSVFFDADKDGDLDLYVTSGSNEVRDNSLYQDRLYLNNGQGEFTKSNGLPSILSNTQSVASLDADQDGDQDLVVGATLMPKKFPFCFDSYLLINNQGVFKRQDLNIQGIINDVKVADINNDKMQDIIMAGDWMPITILINKKGVFENQTKQYGLDKSNGMWNTLLLTDFNKDGKQDVLAGNRGLNNFYKCSQEHPATLYAADFDENGEQEALVNYYFKDKVMYPKYSLDELLQQLPSWRGLFPRYKNYSSASSADIFSKDKFKNVSTYYCYNFSSTAFVAKENTFTPMALPYQMQFGPIYTFATNIKNDPIKYFFAGNNHGVDITMGRYDANKGGACVYTEKGFRMDKKHSGINLSGQVRQMIFVRGANHNQRIVVTENTGAIRLYSSQKN